MSIVSAHPDYNPNEHDLDIATVVCKVDINGDCGVTIYKGADDSGFIRWTDYVANEWCEHYSTVAHAFARLSMLYVCADSGWDLAFMHTPKSFEQKLDIFVMSQVG
jgi:hypothetical protein